MMKKILLLLITFCGISFYVKSQVNIGFELWSPSTYSNNEPSGWGTFNADAFFIPGPMSTFKETVSPGELLSSVKMVTTTGYSLIAGPGNDTLPGLISLGVPLFTGEPGVPYTSRPDYVSFMYKSNPMANDTNAFKVQLSHWDGAATITDGEVLFVEPTVIGSWMTVILPITYQTMLTPDTLKIIASSSIGFLSGGSLIIPGSEFFIDDVNLIFCNINASITSTNVTSLVANDGTATAVATAGISPYIYLWSDGQTAQTAVGLAPGSYTVTITDSVGCMTISSVVINSFTCSMTVGAVSTAETSLGANDGTATASVVGGLAPFSYLWSGGQTTQIVSGLTPGIYNVTVTDANGCMNTATVNVNSASCTMMLTGLATDETSVGANDGTAAANTTLGATPYSYLWSNGDTAQTITNLAPGAYTVNITDANGCTAIDSVFVNAFTCSMVVTTAATNETSLGANDGTGTVITSLGIIPYTYLWNDGQTTQTAIGLASGNYTVVVTDSSGCIDSASVIVGTDQNCIFILMLSPTDETSAGANDGTITVNSIFGTFPYTYLWSDGQTTQTAVGLSPGTYSVVVTDFNGCSNTDSATVQAFNCSMVVNMNSTSETFTGANNATATPIIFFGTPPYTYLWSDGQITETAIGLSPGTYSVSVTDSSGCISSASVTIQAFSCSMTINVTTTNETISGVSDGTATVAVTNGLSPYTYLWSDGQALDSISGLIPATYSVVVTDSNGCTATDSAVVNAGVVCNLFITTTAIGETTSGANDGIASVSVTGGTTPYSYLWSDSQTTDTAFGLVPGMHSITVVDSNGCTATDSTFVNAAVICNLFITTIVTDETTLGANDGTVSVSTTGGTSPFSYSWSDGQTSQTAMWLISGVYSVTVMDSNGCTATDSAIVSAGVVCNVSVVATAIDETSLGAIDGTVYVSVTGGTPPYSYSWSDGQTSTVATGLGAGTYAVTVTDANGCSAIDGATVGSGPNGIKTLNNGLIRVYPNPAASVVTFEISIESGTKINIIDMNGRIVKRVRIVGDVTLVNVEKLPLGMYFYQIINDSSVLEIGKLNIVK